MRFLIWRKIGSFKLSTPLPPSFCCSLSASPHSGRDGLVPILIMAMLAGDARMPEAQEKIVHESWLVRSKLLVTRERAPRKTDGEEL